MRQLYYLNLETGERAGHRTIPADASDADVHRVEADMLLLTDGEDWVVRDSANDGARDDE